MARPTKATKGGTAKGGKAKGGNTQAKIGSNPQGQSIKMSLVWERKAEKAELQGKGGRNKKGAKGGKTKEW